MTQFLTTTLGRFRLVAFLEGLSAVWLFGLAMPLKYGFDMPAMIRPAGSVHGALFVIYLFALVSVWIVQKWPISKAVLAVLASIIPLGTFVLEYKIRDEVPREHEQKA